MSTAATVAIRGFFVISLAASGSPVCTGGDSFHTWLSHEATHFAALSQPVGTALPSIYWFNATATAALRGARRYSLTVSLVETVRRVPPSLSASAAAAEAERARGTWRLDEWLRRSECVWRTVGVAGTAVLVPAAENSVSGRGGATEPVCGALPRASGVAYAALTGDAESPSCGDAATLC